MPANTATQGLTYPLSSDALKDRPAQLEKLAGQMDARFHSHDQDLDRTEKVPFALIEMFEERAYNTFSDADQTVAFDTVSVDTANLVDLSLNPRIITLPRTGYWVIGGYMQTRGLGSADTWCTLLFGVPGGTNVLGQSSRDAGGAVSYTSWSFTARVTVPNSVTYLKFFASGSGVVQPIYVPYAQLFAYWQGDL